MAKAHVLTSIAWMVAVAALVAGVVWALRPAPVPVDVAAAEIGPLQVTVEDDGEVRVRDRYSVTAPVAGRIERIALRPGDEVTPGSALVRLFPAALDPRTRSQAEERLQGAQDAGRAAVAVATQARAALEQARRDRDRAAVLFREGIASPESYEKAEVAARVGERDLEAADFRAQAAAHDVEVARAALLAASVDAGVSGRPVVVRAPVGGRVLQVPDASARVVAPGQVLLEVGDLGHLEVTVDLLSTDAVRVAPGATMLIEQWGGEATLRARVRTVEPSAFTKVSALGIEEQRVNVLGDLLDRAGPLGDRYRVQVRIVLWEAASVLKVPWSAIVRDGDQWRVYVVEDGYARARAVTVDHQSATEVEVVTGLRAGEHVVRHPTEQIVDGTRVRTRQ